MKPGEIIKINGVEYKIRVGYSFEEKVSRRNEFLGIKLGITVLDVKQNKVLMWEEIKKTYLSEKICDYVQNTINGQKTFYWDWNKEEL